MNKKNLKLIMELIFIFILPIAFMLISVKSEVVNTYDENGNLLTTEKIFDFSEDTILRDYNDNITYINTLKYNQLVKNGNFVDGSYWSPYNINNMNMSILNNEVKCTLLNTNYASYTYGIQQFLPLPLNNTYIITLDFYATYSTSIRIELDNNGIITLNNLLTNSYNHVEIIVTPNNSYGNYLIIYPFNNNSNDNIANEYYYIKNVNITNLTNMFGSGYEPTSINEFNNYIDTNIYHDYIEEEDIIIYSNNVISDYHEFNYTWYSKLFNELYNDLQINNNIVLKLITTYIILWVIMFLVWHLLYRFVDFMVHLFDRKER